MLFIQQMYVECVLCPSPEQSTDGKDTVRHHPCPEPGPPLDHTVLSCELEKGAPAPQGKKYYISQYIIYNSKQICYSKWIINDK